jgi:hypothetical protein
MDPAPVALSARFELLLDVWRGGDLGALAGLITPDYLGHMLHLPDGERTAEQYQGWIVRYREANPGTRFRVEDQSASGNRLWSRLTATHGDGRQASGMNVSRFVGGRIAEEWAVWSDWRV